MTIVELGAFGEFVGSIAVVVSLVYLAVQIRHAGRQTKAASIQARTDTVAHSYGVFLENPVLIDAFMKNMRHEALTSGEQVRLLAFLGMIIHKIHHLHLQYRLGLIDDLDFNSTRTELRNLFRTHGAVGRLAYEIRESEFHPSFRTVARKVLSEIEEPEAVAA